MSYREALKSLRLAYKLTQGEFAELLQVSKATIQKLEAGSYPPSEKVRARLVELFGAEKFRTELRPRVETGDLRVVKEVFGDLFDLVDANVADGLSARLQASGQTINLAEAYMELKNNYSEFRDVVRSQQDTIRDLSSTSKTMAESNKNLSVSTQNFSESSKILAESTYTTSISIKNFSESNKTLAESTKTLAESNRNLSVSIKNFSAGRRNAAGKR